MLVYTDDFIAIPVNSVIRSITIRYIECLQVDDLDSLNIRNDLLLGGA
jgi:hypothetical protein